MSDINRQVKCRFQPLRHFVPPPLYFVEQNTGEELKKCSKRILALPPLSCPVALRGVSEQI